MHASAEAASPPSTQTAHFSTPAARYSSASAARSAGSCRWSRRTALFGIDARGMPGTTEATSPSRSITRLPGTERPTCSMNATTPCHWMPNSSTPREGNCNVVDEVNYGAEAPVVDAEQVFSFFRSV